MSAHETMRRLGVNLPEMYAKLCSPELAHLAVEIDKHIPVLDALDTAIQQKADLNLIWPRWALWLFDVELAQYEISAPVAALFRRECDGDLPTRKEWKKVEAEASKVWDSESRYGSLKKTAARAARSAAKSSSQTVVRAAVEVAWEASWREGGSAQRASDANDTWTVREANRAGGVEADKDRTEAWSRMAEKLKTLLKVTPVARALKALDTAREKCAACMEALNELDTALHEVEPHWGAALEDLNAGRVGISYSLEHWQTLRDMIRRERKP